MRLVVLNHVSLDGVMQAPGRKDEDTRGGFAHGGWALPDGDEIMARTTGPGSQTGGGGLLLGRRSYDEMLSYWNQQGGPFKDALNAARKFVVSRSPSTRLPWPNSTLLHGDVPSAVKQLKEQPDGDLLIMGSGALIRSLLPHHLIDEFMVVIHPLILGSGQRMFPDQGEMERLQLVESIPTTKGVIIARYRPARAAESGHMATAGRVEAT